VRCHYLPVPISAPAEIRLGQFDDSPHDQNCEHDEKKLDQDRPLADSRQCRHPQGQEHEKGQVRKPVHLVNPVPRSVVHVQEEEGDARQYEGNQKKVTHVTPKKQEAPLGTYCNS
jgi:hypothetical protein